MCVSVRVIALFAPASDAEQVPVRSPGLGLFFLTDGVPGPEVTNLKAPSELVVVGPLPLYLPPAGTRDAPLLHPLGAVTAPASLIRVELLRIVARIHAGLWQRR